MSRRAKKSSPRQKRTWRFTVALWIAISLSIAVPVAWRFAVPKPVWSPRLGVPDTIREPTIDFEDGGFLHVRLGLMERGATVAVEDALFSLRIVPRQGERALDEVARLETRIGPAHFQPHGGEPLLDEYFPCNLRGRVPPGVCSLEARVTILVPGRPALEGLTQFSAPAAVTSRSETASRRP